MGNPRPVTYTERVGVAVSDAQRERLRVFARGRGESMGVVVREAALEHIGRHDLSFAKETAFPVGKNLERRGAIKHKDHGARITVHLTRAQRLALELAAATRSPPTALAALLRDAALLKAGVAPTKPPKKRGRGRPLGAPTRA